MHARTVIKCVCTTLYISLNGMPTNLSETQKQAKSLKSATFGLNGGRDIHKKLANNIKSIGKIAY